MVAPSDKSSVKTLDGLNFSIWKKDMNAHLMKKKYQSINALLDLVKDETKGLNRPTKQEQEAIYGEMYSTIEDSVKDSLETDYPDLTEGDPVALVLALENMSKEMTSSMLELKRIEFENLKRERKETVAEFADRVTKIYREYKTVGGSVTNGRLNERFVYGLGKEYRIFVPGAASLTFSVLKGKIMEAEIEMKKDSNSEEYGEINFIRFNGTCFNCGKRGHKQAKCRLLKKDGRYEDRSRWKIDSGASNHVTGNKGDFENYHYISPKTFYLPDESKIHSIGRGDIKVSKKLTLRNVNYIPEVTNNLISVSELNREGMSVLFKDLRVCIRDKSGKVVATGSNSNGTFELTQIRM
jgi:hypothetical protein